jgi:formylglycine-generating enzyme required for sulfatase activity
MGLPRSRYDAYLARVKGSNRQARVDEIHALMMKGDRDGAETKILEWEVDEPNSGTVKQLKKELDRPEGMVTIPGGAVLGREVDAFNLDIYETTNREFLEFVKANPQYRRGSVGQDIAEKEYLQKWSDPLKFPAELANRPVVFVSQPVADAYCHWRKKRLPTSDEWGLAAGEGRRKYPWGDKEPTNELANFNSLTGGPLPGDSHPQGRTPEGVYHMAGNVWELTSTVEDNQAVARGGCYFDTPEYLQTAYRGSRTRDPINYTSRFTGLRCAQ